MASGEIERVGRLDPLIEAIRGHVPRLPVVRLRSNDEENRAENLLRTGLKFSQTYVVLGQVSETEHYLIIDYSDGRILPGMFHLERFEVVPDDEL